ncbi:MAG: hypothetical protein JST92_00475 [Deltaproteobacteria bacterium]|nr:hypothetical protein [Deltaproteobacteria bacterium]
MEQLRSQPSRNSRRAEVLWRTAIAALVIALGSSALMSGCSTSQCKDMKGSGSVFGSIVCGGEGDDAPEATNPNQPNFCSNVRAVMPAFFALLDDKTKPLDGLRQAVKELGQTQCLQTDKERACTEGGTCEVGDCTNGLCPCAHGYNPLADLLVVTFKGLATVSRDGNETATARCASVAEAATLPANKINRMCEIRRLLDVLLEQNGGNKVLDDPAVTSVLLALLDYIQGKGYAAPHYDLFTTLGRMAGNPGICAPADAYNLLDKLLGWLTPTNAVPVLDHLSTLLADPQMQQLLGSISGSGTGTPDPANRAALITLVTKTLLPDLIAARNGEDGLSAVNNLVQTLVYNSSTYTQAFKDKVRAVINDVNGLVCDPSLHTDGSCPAATAPQLWPELHNLLTCLNDPNVDSQGELVGAIYDLLSLKPLQPGVSGVDLPTLLNALKALAQLDPTGQVGRTGQLIIRGLRDDEDATEAVRQLLAQLLTAEIGQKLIPSLEVTIQDKVLGEIVTLLDDLLYQCKQPK